MTDYTVRIAAESLLGGSVSSPHYRTLSHSQSVNLVTEDLVAGHRPDGRMSTVRRFFCLFATFDLLFTALMWLICVMMKGETLEQILNREIVNYSIKISLFDIVLVAICRFLLLLLFYGVLYIHNWSVIALTTSGTCAFLIAKVFVYDWPNASEPVFQVFLILTSFTLSWGEAWFLDFRVLPQELQAKQIIEAIASLRSIFQVFLILASFTLSWGEAWFLDFRVLPQELQAKQIIEAIAGHHNQASERTPLLPHKPLGVASTVGESTAHWFSPVESPAGTPRPGIHQVILTQEQENEEERDFRLSADRERHALSISSETFTQRNERLASQRTRTSAARSQENEEERDLRLSADRNRHALSRSSETFTQRNERLASQQTRTSAARSQIDEYKRMAEDSMQQAFKVITLPNWKFEKRGVTKGDVVETRQTEKFGKVYRFTGIVDCPAEFLFREFKDNVTKLPDWNPTILRSELIKEVGDGIDLSYQVTAGGGKGIIAPRDFVILRRCAPLNKQGAVVQSDPYCYISSGVSVTVPGYPPNKDFVRGNNKVGCWCLKPVPVKHIDGTQTQQTQFQWLMCCDLKGKIPQFVLDAAFATVMLDYIVHVRKFAGEARAKGLF